MTYDVCQLIDQPITEQEEHVIRVCSENPLLGKPAPDPFFEHIIQALFYALTVETTAGITPLTGYLIPLAKAFPDYFFAVNCFVNGNLLARYDHQKVKRQVSSVE